VEFTDKKARDVAVPLSELVTLPETTTPDEIERAVAKHGFSRYVIVDAEGIPLGYVHLKDVLRAAEGAGADEKVAVPIKPKRIHHMVPVAETTDLEDALALMRRTSRHLAQVRNARARRRRCSSSRTSSRSSSAKCTTRRAGATEPKRRFDSARGPRSTTGVAPRR
jgi:CBS domain containing-hemolysin-like protein